MPPFRGVFPKKGAKKQGPLSLAEKRPLCVLILLLPDHPQPSQKQDTVQCSLAVEVSALAASNLIQLPDIIQHQFAVLFIQLCVLSDLVADVGESSLPASFRQLLIQLLQSGFDEAVYGILQDTIDRLIETALQELDQKLPEAGGEAALSHISDQIRQDAQLDEQHRKLMLDYIRQLNQVTCRQCRHLYRQGALDCVLLLRGLGVIR